jgi:hypothetical protein
MRGEPIQQKGGRPPPGRVHRERREGAQAQRRGLDSLGLLTWLLHGLVSVPLQVVVEEMRARQPTPQGGQAAITYHSTQTLLGGRPTAGIELRWLLSYH